MTSRIVLEKLVKYFGRFWQIVIWWLDQCICDEIDSEMYLTEKATESVQECIPVACVPAAR